MRSLGAILSVLLATACGDEPKPNPAPSEQPTDTAPAPATANGLQIDVAGPAEVQEGANFDLSASVRNSDLAEVRYAWSQIGVRPKLPIATPYSPSIQLRAPEGTADYELLLSLRARAGAHDVTREVKVLVRADDDPPVPELVAPERAECGELVALTGQAHNEIFQGITVEWLQTGDGPRVALDATDRLQASFFAPEHEGPYEVELELHVRDGTNPDAIARAKIAVECDPAAAPLPEGTVLVLSSDAGVLNPLPRGAWELAGTVELASEDGAAPATVLLRFEAAAQAGALSLARSGPELALATAGFVREEGGAWIEPEWSGGLPLGPWPAGVPLGFAFDFDGREVAVRFGPGTDQAKWPELPGKILLPLGHRPQVFAVVVEGSGATLGGLQLRALGR